jgi:hypothetical protein
VFDAVKLGTQAIGAAGELLVQYQLLKQGIDSAKKAKGDGAVKGRRTGWRRQDRLAPLPVVCLRSDEIREYCVS